MVGLLEDVLEAHFTKRFHLGRFGTFDTWIALHFCYIIDEETCSKGNQGPKPMAERSTM